MEKDYAAITKAREIYLETREATIRYYDQVITKAEEDKKKALGKAWSIRQEAIASAGGFVATAHERAD